MDFPSGPNPAADRGAAERDVDRATQHQDKEESERAQCKGARVGDGVGDGGDDVGDGRAWWQYWCC